MVDPIKNIEGFYFWIHGNIERCKGFYIFDKTGTKITVGQDEGQETEEAALISPGTIQNIAIGVLALLVIILLFSVKSANTRIAALEDQHESSVLSTNQNFSVLQQQISSLQSELNALTPQETATPDDNTVTDEENAQ